MIALLEPICAIVRLLLIFTLILVLIKRKWSLGNAFVLGALGLGLIFGMPPLAVLRSFGRALADPKTMSLSLVVSLILVLSHSLEQSGQMERLLNRFKGMIRRPRINLVIFPALIGLLPMPGGAIFSAPMVKNLGRRHHLSPSQLSYTNYWFRHIWEYWWPLYPGVLLASALADVNIWRLVFYTLPLTVVAVLIGYRPICGAITAGEATAPANDKGAFFKELAPIAFVIVFGLACGQLFSTVLPQALLSVAKELGLILALLIAIVWVWRGNLMGASQCRAIVTRPEMLKMIYMVCAILIFKQILQDSGAVLKISQEMLHLRIPLLPIAMLLPFLVGGVAGITIAFVGTTFPILISLIQAFGQTQLMLPYLMLALACGFAGVLFSPLHLCLQLSNAYFGTTLLPVYKHLTGPVIFLVISALAYFSLLRYLLS